MKKIIVIGICGFFSIPIISFLGYILLKDYISYSWYTESLEGNYVGELIQLCGEHKKYYSELHSTTANNEIIAKAQKEANGKPLTYFEGRGFVYEQSGKNTIQIVELFRVSHAENPECAL